MNKKTVLLTLGLFCISASYAWAQNQNPLLIELLRRIELLEQEVRQLRGELELLQYQRQQEPQTISQSSPTTLPPLGPSPNTTTIAPEPTRIEPLSSTTPPTQDEQSLYETAFNQLRNSQYAQAASQFEDFLRRYPGSTLTADAYYWLGESYYVQRQFEQARQIFLTLGAEYPNSSKLPDVMLKLGYIYSETGNTDQAREMLEKLIQTYPDTIAANLAEVHLQNLP